MKRQGIKLRYLSRGDRKTLAQYISRRAKLPNELVEFGLCCRKDIWRSTPGAARNTALVATAGERFVMVDDDSVCRLFQPSDYRSSELSLQGWGNGSEDPVRHVPFATLDEALQSFEEVNLDFMGLHEQVLGQPYSIDSALNRQAVHIEGSATWNYPPSTTPRAVVSSVGRIGDCATDWAAYLLLQGPSSLESILSVANNSFEELLIGRQVAARARGLTLWNGPEFSTFNLGIDNRRVLPPFSPADRGEDTLYGYELYTCVPGYLLALQPFMLLHQPMPPRKSEKWWEFEPLLRPTAAACKFITTFMHSLAFRAKRPADAEATMVELGEFLELWASTNLNDFAEQVVHYLWRSGDMLARNLDRGAAQCSPALRGAYEKTRDHLIECFSKVRVPPLESDDWESLRWRHLQQYCLSFGQLLQVWPEILRLGNAFLNESKEAAMALD